MEITRSFDHGLFKSVAQKFNGNSFSYEAWLANQNNLMYVVGDNVGLATYEYPGCYTVHWFFTARGKEALDLAFAMHDKLYRDGAEITRGLTPIDLKEARYLAKRLGYETLEVMEFDDGFYDVMCLTKQAFDIQWKKRYG